MKWSLIATLALQAIAITAGADDAFWSAFIEDVDSFPSAAPSPGPTPAPSPGPTPAPSPGPTEGPTPSPSASPTPAPSPEPSPEPSAAPSEAPTGECSIGSCLNCTAVVGGVEIDCSAILPETQPVCECPECVRELQFKYTGKACQANQVASGTCTDNSPNPFIAGYRITNALDATEVIATGQAQQGDTITVDAISLNGCLPNTLAVTISVPTGAVTQTFTIDSSCDGGQGLILVDDYGAFEARGYSCSPTDIHNCEQVASYGLKVCNTGPEVQQIFEFFLQSKETVTGDMETCDILEDVPPADVTLAPDACYYSTKPANLDRCVNSSYCVDVSASATNPVTGLPPNCPGVDEIKFGWPGLPPVPATPSPRYVFFVVAIATFINLFLFSNAYTFSFLLAALHLVLLLRHLPLLLVSLTLSSRVVPTTTFPSSKIAKAAHRSSPSDTMVEAVRSQITFSNVKNSVVKTSMEVLHHHQQRELKVTSLLFLEEVATFTSLVMLPLDRSLLSMRIRNLISCLLI